MLFFVAFIQINDFLLRFVGQQLEISAILGVSVPHVCLKLIDSIEAVVTFSVVTKILFLIVVDFPNVLGQCVTAGERAVTVRVLAFEGPVAGVLSHMVSHFIFV